MEPLPTTRGRVVEELEVDLTGLKLEHSGTVKLPIRLPTYQARRDFMKPLETFMALSSALDKQREAQEDTATTRTQFTLEYADMILRVRFDQLRSIIDVARLDAADRAIIEHPEFVERVAVDEVGAIIDRFQRRLNLAG